MAFIPEDIIDKVRDEVAIEDVIGHFIPLKQKGLTFWGICPFHGEKTPSFHVHPDRQIFYCFGCGKGGNVFRFLMEREGMSFPEAVQWCASRIGLDLERFLSSESEGESLRGRILTANQRVAAWYAELLRGPEGREAREYAQRRGLRPETLEDFQLGFAPRDGSALMALVEKEGLDLETLLHAQLLRRKPDQPPFAYFRSRLIFPIQGAAQKIHGFGGRILGPGEPKYLNSPETAVFHKRSTLYALTAARKEIIRTRTAILVEGYLDALALHQAGWDQAVATCGTAFTPQQAQALGRYAERVILLFDGDRAGLKAAYKAAETALCGGLDVRIAQLPEGQDPADLLEAGQSDEMGRVLDGATGLVDWMAGIVEKRGDKREVKERALHQLRDLFVRVEDPIRSELLVQEAADRFHVPRTLFATQSALEDAPRPAPAAPARQAGKRPDLERRMLQMALGDRAARERLLSLRDADDFLTEQHRALYLLLHDAEATSTRLQPSQLAQDDAELSDLIAALCMNLPDGDFDSVSEVEAASAAMDDLNARTDAAQRRRELEELFRSGGDWASHASLKARQSSQGAADANRPTQSDTQETEEPERGTSHP